MNASVFGIGLIILKKYIIEVVWLPQNWIFTTRKCSLQQGRTLFKYDTPSRNSSHCAHWGHSDEQCAIGVAYLPLKCIGDIYSQNYLYSNNNNNPSEYCSEYCWQYSPQYSLRKHLITWTDTFWSVHKLASMMSITHMNDVWLFVFLMQTVSKQNFDYSQQYSPFLLKKNNIIIFINRKSEYCSYFQLNSTQNIKVIHQLKAFDALNTSMAMMGLLIVKIEKYRLKR